MSKLEKWLPFKFRKKNQQEKHQESQPSGTSQHGLMQTMPHVGLAPWETFLGPQMQKMMQDFFSDPFFRDPFGRFDQMDRWFGDFSPRRFSPGIEVSDDGKALKVTAELPGMEKDDVTLQVEDNMLVISGEKKNESESDDSGVFRSERYYGYFQRAVPLPDDVDRDRVDAVLKNGILTVRFQRRENAQSESKKIKIN